MSTLKLQRTFIRRRCRERLAQPGSDLAPAQACGNSAGIGLSGDSVEYDLSELSEEDATYFREHGYPRQKPEVEARIFARAHKLVQELAPHQAFIDKRIQELGELRDNLFSRDHDLMGKILKHHLILEFYINRHFETIFPANKRPSRRLAFAQKLELIPIDNFLMPLVIPGLREINDVRNAFAHDIDANLSLDSLKTCRKVLGLMHPYFNKTYSDPIDVIEDFTGIACLRLDVDKDLDQIFKQANARVGPA
jgi:hypothetical protein